MQFIDLKAQYAALKHEIDAAIHAVLAHGQFIMGPEVAALEREIAAFLRVKHVITCANGTDALQLLYMAYGIGRGDAVFCPDISFIASVEPACVLGAVPIFCDVDARAFNICPDSLSRQIAAVKEEGRLRPRAILAVDFLGNPADYDTLAEIARQHGLPLIEDAAQSFGGVYRGAPCGSLGDAAATSFFPAKPLGCYGDGGAVMTNDDDMAALCRSLRAHGKGDDKYANVRVGMNSRLDTIQAAVLLVKLGALRDYELDRRAIVAARYDAALMERFQLLNVEKGNVCAYAQYAFLADSAEQRDAIAARLATLGIPTMVYYPHPQHVLKAFQNAPPYGETYPRATAYCRRTLSIPMHPYLDEGAQDTIIKAILEPGV
ncbi:MAG: DegT/DnrJ/EryC1/StrS family aminotransferase [Clostridiales bacterium]|jgi:dTDP-4-amino-4,6-dideoxygalactose transaminase|nr:DegT/DnrJ/EryC1/StrS family aminotransferase [Clostridiales bacterium]